MGHEGDGRTVGTGGYDSRGGRGGILGVDRGDERGQEGEEDCGSGEGRHLARRSFQGGKSEQAGGRGREEERHEGSTEGRGGRKV